VHRPLNLTITRAVAALHVTRNTLSELVNGKRGISPEMAVRLEKVFGGSAESWLFQQAQYDLARVRRGRLTLKRLELVSKGPCEATNSPVWIMIARSLV
jgi:addiction module HigA family antidote